MHLPVGALLAFAQTQFRHVHLIMSGIVSITVPLAGGNSPEICMMGPGEVVETRELVSGTFSLRNAVVKTAGVALRLRLQVAQDALLANAELREYMRASLQQQNRQVDQIAACNSVHQIEPRLARYLLMLQDRQDRDGVQITQDALGLALGVRRTSVTASAGHLQDMGLITFRRGTVFIRDRAGLQAAACECYAALQKAEQRHSAAVAPSSTPDQHGTLCFPPANNFVSSA